MEKALYRHYNKRRVDFLTKSLPLLVKNDQIQKSVVIGNDQGEHIIPYIAKVETKPNQGVHLTIFAFIQKGLFHVMS